MVKAVAVTPSTSAHEMVRELVDGETDAVSPSGGKRSIYKVLIDYKLM